MIFNVKPFLFHFSSTFYFYEHVPGHFLNRPINLLQHSGDSLYYELAGTLHLP
jgi:hypothetical protein